MMSYQLFLFSLLIPNTYNTSIYHLNKDKKHLLLTFSFHIIVFITFLKSLDVILQNDYKRNIDHIVHY